MRVIFKSWDYDTQQIMLEARCEDCGTTEFFNLEDFAKENFDGEKIKMTDILEEMQYRLWHFKTPQNTCKELLPKSSLETIINALEQFTCRRCDDKTANSHGMCNDCMQEVSD